MQIHGYTENGNIDVTINNVRLTVPTDPSNRHYKMVMEEVEKTGIVIPPYVAPVIDLLTVPLKPYQFWAVVRATGREQALRDWVAAMTDTTKKGIASAMLEFSLEFRRDHPLMEEARIALGMTVQELDDLWKYGHTL